MLDENILESQRQLLRSWRIPVRQIGLDVATVMPAGVSVWRVHTLPEQRDGIGRKVRVLRNDGEPVNLSCCDQKTVKRISMVPRQANQRAVMVKAWRQDGEAIGQESAREQVFVGHVELELAEADSRFHCPFPAFRIPTGGTANGHQ